MVKGYDENGRVTVEFRNVAPGSKKVKSKNVYSFKDFSSGDRIGRYKSSREFILKLRFHKVISKSFRKLYWHLTAR